MKRQMVLARVDYLSDQRPAASFKDNNYVIGRWSRDCVLWSGQAKEREGKETPGQPVRHLVPEIETFLSDSYKRFRLSLRFQSPLPILAANVCSFSLTSRQMIGPLTACSFLSRARKEEKILGGGQKRRE